ncbi:unnamed protein product [Cylicostephanus goldi]|uniref:Uncharacterized protein n=1 Tax=Cylicostephanus goldi TaxID=71465 RepID=A0A3P6T399_CYLGO|nr:unnamed protein product [Cylicostephanus goldi]
MSRTSQYYILKLKKLVRSKRKLQIISSKLLSIV